MKITSLKPVPYQGMVYRNIFTCSPSQNLYDDIADESDWSVVDTMVQRTSGIDHQLPQVQRPFQYGSVEEEVLDIFFRGNWKPGRFGDGREYGVWYSAEDPKTSVFETCWWAYQLGLDNVLKRGEVYTTDRKMFQAHLRTGLAIDLIQAKEIFPLLTHPSDYNFCRKLGKKLNEERWELLRTPSARKRNGICTPLFSSNPIKNSEFIYYLQYHVHPDGFIGVSSSQEEMNFSLWATGLEHPYGL